MVPRALADELSAVDPHSPGYLGRLARYARAPVGRGRRAVPLAGVGRVGRLHDVRSSATSPQRYDIDGVHFDYIRYPTERLRLQPRHARGVPRDRCCRDLGAADQRRYDARAGRRRAADLHAGVSGALARVPHGAADRAPHVAAGRRQGASGRRRWSASRSCPIPREAATHRLQDWRGWLDAGLVDVICPMAYTTDAGAVRRRRSPPRRQIAGAHPLWAGIGAYRLSSGSDRRERRRRRAASASAASSCSPTTASRTRARPRLRVAGRPRRLPALTSQF